MRLEYQDDIDRYLLGRMSVEERTSFEAKCAENQELKEQLEHTRDVRTVISERSKMLAKIQEWDDEYDMKEKVASNKTMWPYWLTGVAAVLVTGFFLYPIIRTSRPEKTGEMVSMGQEPQKAENIGGNVTDSIPKSKEAKRLLAQNDEKKDEKGQTTKPDNGQVLSFGKAGFKPASSQGQDGQEHELRHIEEECNTINQKMSQLRQQLDEGEISQDFYNSSVGLLKHQKDYLSWRKAKLLIDLGRQSEALEILKDLRRTKGVFQNKADSLYNEIK